VRKTAAIVAALMIALTGVVVVPGAATALDVGQWQRNKVTGHFYKQVDGLTWADAETYAVSVGGHLVTINDAAEQAWLERTFTQPDTGTSGQPLVTLWIGMNDRAVEGTWVWSSGEAATYTRWLSGEPNNCTWCDSSGSLPQGEDAAVMNFSDPTGIVGWNDLADFGRHSGIVEVTRRPPEPKTPNSLVGSFDILMLGGSSQIAGHIVVDVREPTATSLVPGSFDVVWVSGNLIRESHAQLVKASFSRLSPTYTIAIAEGVVCDYRGAGDASCHDFAVGLSEVQPEADRAVYFADSKSGDGQWLFDEFYIVGKGTFSLNFTSPTGG